MARLSEVESAVRAGDRLRALVLYRQHTGASLSEATRAIEAIERELDAAPVPIVGDLDEVFASLEGSDDRALAELQPQALRRARELARRATELADAHRDGKLSERHALAVLAREHPGFSAATYQLAFGRGLRDTR